MVVSIIVQNADEGVSDDVFVDNAGMSFIYLAKVGFQPRLPTDATLFDEHFREELQ